MAIGDNDRYENNDMVSSILRSEDAAWTQTEPSKTSTPESLLLSSPL